MTARPSTSRVSSKVVGIAAGLLPILIMSLGAWTYIMGEVSGSAYMPYDRYTFQGWMDAGPRPPGGQCAPGQAVSAGPEYARCLSLDTNHNLTPNACNFLKADSLNQQAGLLIKYAKCEKQTDPAQ